jgi:hypothetical protein
MHTQSSFRPAPLEYYAPWDAEARWCGEGTLECALRTQAPKCTQRAMATACSSRVLCPVGRRGPLMEKRRIVLDAFTPKVSTQKWDKVEKGRWDDVVQQERLKKNTIVDKIVP